jgi:hypothetical protein
MKHALAEAGPRLDSIRHEFDADRLRGSSLDDREGICDAGCKVSCPQGCSASCTSYDSQ